MSNRRAVPGSGVEDPLPPQPGPSQPTGGHHNALPTKRKTPDVEHNESGAAKRTKSSQSSAPANRSKTMKGERKAGGLIITPLPSTFNGAKAREIVAPSRQDLEVEEDVHRMDAERERLRVREAQSQSQSQSTAFKTPLFPPASSVRRHPTGSTSATKSSTPGNRTTIIDITQPLPLQDTPKIERNRAMRGEPVERRSSLSRRGKRASSSFEHTGVIPQPHASVSTANFHKHIDLELPEAHRARHLLLWCASRKSARSTPNSSSRKGDPPLPPLTAEGATILQEVQKEVLKMLAEQRIDTSFSNRADEDADRPKVKQHEQNAKNLKREDDFMRHIDRCKRETEAWTSTIQLYNARQTSTIEALSRQRHQKLTSTDWVPSDVSDPLHERELQWAQLARRCKEKEGRKRGGSPLSLRMAEAESKVDRAHSTLHISQQFTKRTTRNLDKRFEGLATALAARSQSSLQPSEVSTLANLVSANPNPPGSTEHSAPPDTLAILRALTRTDMEHPRKEMGDAVRKAAREVQRVNATPGRSSAGGVPANERRLTAVTPRITPGTPRRGGTPRQRSEGAESGGGGGS